MRHGYVDWQRLGPSFWSLGGVRTPWSACNANAAPTQGRTTGSQIQGSPRKPSSFQHFCHDETGCLSRGVEGGYDARVRRRWVVLGWGRAGRR